MSSTEIDRWTVQRLISKLNARELVLPAFQRGIVWNEERRKDLIESLTKGWPIGSILVADDPRGGNSLRLLDGLQRSTALRMQLDEGMNWVQRSQIPRDAARRAEELLGVAEEELTEWLLSTIRSKPRLEEVQEGDLAYAALQRYAPELVAESDNYSALREIFAPVVEGIRRTLRDIRSAEIPVIVFHSRDPLEQAEVFARLNSKGIALSKLQILAATWADRVVATGAGKHWDGIIDAVMTRYADLEMKGFEIADYDAQTIRSTLGTFEFVFGLGKYFAREFPELWGQTGPTDEDAYVFSLLAAIISKDATNKSIQNLSDQIETLGKAGSLDNLVEAIWEACDVVRKSIDRTVNMRLGGQKVKKVYHTELQMVAYVAIAFSIRFAVAGGKVIRQNNKTVRATENAFRSSLLPRMLFDLMRGAWRSAGDKRIGEVLASPDEYFSRPTERMWRNVYQNWSQDRLARTRDRSARRRQPTGADALLLQLVYVSMLDLEAIGQLDLEWDHVIPASKLEDLAKRSGGLPIHVYANFGLLDEVTNRRKGGRDPRTYVQSLVSDQDHERERIYDLLIFEDEWLPEGEVSAESYREFLTRRSDALFERYVLNWSEPDSDTRAA